MASQPSSIQSNLLKNNQKQTTFNSLDRSYQMKKYQLTKREVEIIKMIAREFTSKEIGDSLFISEFTVSTHRRNIMKKLNSKNV